MITRALIVGGLVTALLLAADSVSAQTTLRYKFKEGEKIQYVAEQKMTTAMSVAGKEITMKMNQSMTMARHVTKVDAKGNAYLTQSFKHIRFTVSGLPGVNMTYDSKTDKNPGGPIGGAIAPLFNAMVGAEFEMIQTPRGEIKDIKIPKAVTDGFAKIPGAVASGVLSKDGLKQMMQQSSLLLPATAVSKGDSWSQKSAMKMPQIGTIKVNQKLTYNGTEQKAGQDLQKIAITAKSTLTPAAGAPLAMKLKSQEGKGVAYFNNASGRLVETGLTQKMRMEINIAGQTISQTINQTGTLKLKTK